MSNRRSLSATLWYKFMLSPIGPLKLVASNRGLVGILWENDNPRRVRLTELVERAEHPVLVRAEKELNEYFTGMRSSFTVPLDMRGTPFQRQVWGALLGIPFGETRTYGQLAIQLGNPKATRAVGAANGRNPIAILVPCHRVIGHSGKLTGFAGGLDAKAYLLKLEGRGEHLFPNERRANTPPPEHDQHDLS
jgi:methylated-DNA-[protein]-cysteine S-methyltransferase